MYLCMNLWDYTSAKLKTLRARSVNLSNLSLSFTCLSPPFQWQRVEPVPLCRSGKLCSPSYNTQNLASRNTTVASRLIKRAHLLTRDSLPRNNRPPRCHTQVHIQKGGQAINFSCANRSVSLAKNVFSSVASVYFVTLLETVGD